ncbi:MAG TPA: hypothetical protein VGJ99_02235 [Actinomycetota bacterium]|jgi:hypothetical protein
MQEDHPRRAWKAWRDTIIVVVAVIAVGSLASASPSLRAPRGPHESLPTVATGANGPAGLSGQTVATGPEIQPAEEGVSSDGVNFTACEGMTNLDNAICRHEALLVVHPDNHGLQNSLTHLHENKAEHEAKADEEDGGEVPPEHGASSSSSNGHGQSGESHGNAGGNGNSKGH